MTRARAAAFYYLLAAARGEALGNRREADFWRSCAASAFRNAALKGTDQ